MEKNKLVRKRKRKLQLKGSQIKWRHALVYCNCTLCKGQVISKRQTAKNHLQRFGTATGLSLQPVVVTDQDAYDDDFSSSGSDDEHDDVRLPAESAEDISEDITISNEESHDRQISVSPRKQPAVDGDLSSSSDDENDSTSDDSILLTESTNYFAEDISEENPSEEDMIQEDIHDDSDKPLSICEPSSECGVIIDDHAGCEELESSSNIISREG